MNRKLLALLMAAITLPVAAAQYVKPGAVLTLNPGKGNAEFNINASTGDGSGVCNMDGTAQQIAAGESQKRRWVWNDSRLNRQNVSCCSQTDCVPCHGGPVRRLRCDRSVYSPHGCLPVPEAFRLPCSAEPPDHLPHISLQSP